MSTSNVQIAIIDTDEVDFKEKVQAQEQNHDAPPSIAIPQPLSTRTSSNTLSPSVPVSTELEKGEPRSNRPSELSSLRKYTLLFIFCLAQILDTYNASSLFAAIPTLVAVLHMKQSDSVWLISGYQLTFSSFLLISGRISDLYSAKISFIIGVASLSVFSLIIGFVEKEIPFLVLRALTGVGAAFTIPSALTLLVKTFPEPQEQALAIAVLGGCAGVANILGLILGAIFTQYASWRWVFWFVTIVGAPVIFVGAWIIPEDEKNELVRGKSRVQKLTSLDVVGVTDLTAALILFIYALTSGSSVGWGSGGVIAPLVISIALVPVFLWWERRTERRNPGGACIPPKTWFYPNFTPLFFVALLPFFWWMTSFTIFTNYWQDVVHWTVINTVIHLIPLGVVTFIISFTAAPLARRYQPKYLILFGLTLLVASTILLMFADESTTTNYWRFAFPAFILGSWGGMTIFGQTNIAIFKATPPRIAGIVGAIFNAALQLGGAVGLAIVGSIESSVLLKTQRTHGVASTLSPSTDAFSGDRAAYEFLLGAVLVEVLVVLVFYRTDRRVGDVGVGVGVKGVDGDGDVVAAAEGDVECDHDAKLKNADADVEKGPGAELSPIDEREEVNVRE